MRLLVLLLLELDRGAEVEATEGSSPELVAPDELEARVLLGQRVPGAWRAAGGLGDGRRTGRGALAVEEGVVVGELGQQAEAGGLLAGGQRGQTEVGAAVEGEAFDALAAGEAAAGLAAAAIESAVLLGHVGQHLLLLQSGEPRTTGTERVMAPEQGELLVVVAHGDRRAADRRERRRRDG